jgi:oxygen-independent coproporphyrinogen-3 oxidase
MKKNKFNQYEISNFSKSGFESIHNKAYWKYQNYAGIGPGAHSTIDVTRMENEDDIQKYVNGHYKKIINLSKREQMEEYLLMGLRLFEGTDIHDFEKRFDQDLFSIINVESEKFKDKFLLENNKIKLSSTGFKFMNKVLIDIFCELDSIEI